MAAEAPTHQYLLFSIELWSDEVTRVGDASVLFDGTNSGCQGDCEQFKGPAFRYLMALYRALAKQGAHAPTSGPSGTSTHYMLTFLLSTMYRYDSNSSHIYVHLSTLQLARSTSS